MQEFYWDTAYLAFQRVKLAELNVAAVANDRKLRIQGEKRVRKDHNVYASNLRRHAESLNLKKPKLSVIKENAAKIKERKEVAERTQLYRSRRAAATSALPSVGAGADMEPPTWNVTSQHVTTRDESPTPP